MKTGMGSVTQLSEHILHTSRKDTQIRQQSGNLVFGFSFLHKVQYLVKEFDVSQDFINIPRGMDRNTGRRERAKRRLCWVARGVGSEYKDVDVIGAQMFSPEKARA